MATVEPVKRPVPGNWYKARLAIGKDPATGKYRQPTEYIEAPNLRTARAEASRMETELKAKTSSSATFGELAERWWEDNPKDNRRNTRQGYRSKLDLHILPRIGEIQLKDLDKTLFTRLKVDLAEPGTWTRATSPRALDAKTINQCLTVCRNICRYGEEGLGWLDQNPAAISRATQNKKAPTSATTADYQAVAQSIEELDLQTMIVVAASTGARLSEVAALQWGDLHLEANEDGSVARASLSVTHMLDEWGDRHSAKAHSERPIPIGMDVLGWLTQWANSQLDRLDRLHGARPQAMHADWFIWPSDESPTKPSKVKRWSDRFRLAARKSDAKGTIHWRALRHLAATLMTNNPDISPATASKILGHANTSMTLDVYAAAIDDQASQATAALSSEITFTDAPTNLEIEIFELDEEEDAGPSD